MQGPALQELDVRQSGRGGAALLSQRGRRNSGEAAPSFPSERHVGVAGVSDKCDDRHGAVGQGHAEAAGSDGHVGSAVELPARQADVEASHQFETVELRCFTFA